MKGTILLNHYDNTHQVEGEEKSRFLRGLLEQMFENTDVVDQIEEIWTDDIILAPAQKVKMRELMTTYNIQVIDDHDGILKIYVEGELIGQFFKPKYRLRRDLTQVDPKKQLFLEMVVECWSVFEASETQVTE
jgi:hypothetical protein